MEGQKHPASYRDPAGFVFTTNKEIYRQVNGSYKENFDHFINSGCYKHLSENGWLISHTEVEADEKKQEKAYKIIKPERIGFISYPYEWSFSMLKDAALLTLTVLKEALKYDMVVKDATPYNVQWGNGRFVFIDTLSFEKFTPLPWVAYRQFCESFLGPLLIARYNNIPVHELCLAYPDGIPLNRIKKILPARARLSFSTFLHIYLHSKFSENKTNDSNKRGALVFTKSKLYNLVSSLEDLIKKLYVKKNRSEWSEYYEEGIESAGYLSSKKERIREWLKSLSQKNRVVDLGCNTGEFSHIASEFSKNVYATDYDEKCIDELYCGVKEGKNLNILPLVINLANPSPPGGLNNTERRAFTERIKGADVVLALALIHHLVIGKNIPLEIVAELFRSLEMDTLIIEFVSSNDSKIVKMIADRNGVCHHYSKEYFIQAFSMHFKVYDVFEIPGTERTLYFLKRLETNKRS